MDGAGEGAHEQAYEGVATLGGEGEEPARIDGRRRTADRKNDPTATAREADQDSDELAESASRLVEAIVEIGIDDPSAGLKLRSVDVDPARSGDRPRVVDGDGCVGLEALGEASAQVRRLSRCDAERQRGVVESFGSDDGPRRIRVLGDA